MAHPLTVVPHLPVVNLERRDRTAGDPVARTHWHVLWLVAQGWYCPAAATVLGYSVEWVRTIVHRYNAGGADAVGDQRHQLPATRGSTRFTGRS